MKVGVLGTGVVGHSLASKLVSLGHEVMMGSRTKDNEKGAEWVSSMGERAHQGDFADTTAFGELLINCTSGLHSLAVLEAAGASSLKGKILLDVSNPLDFSNGFPPSLSVCNTTSLAEQIQEAYPETKVVKTFNTLSHEVMIDPGRVPGEHDLFISGNDVEAKAEVCKLLREGFGWQSIIDLGDITTARGTEAYLLLWTRLWGVLGTSDFNIKIVKREKEST